MQQIEESTGVTPQALLEQPILDAVANEVCEAFQLLTKCRTYGMGMANPISLSEIEAYIRLFDEPSLGREAFIKLIKVMDEAALLQKKS